jgi:tripartite-type tricarboxylate transporter receptor subunit TctC
MRKNPSSAGARLSAIFDLRRETSQEYAKEQADRRGRRMGKWLAVIVAALIGLTGSGLAAAQEYPTRPITMIVPFPAGGATDTLARFLGERLRAKLGQPVIIENVGGAAGSIGVGRAVRSPADGYTLSIGTSTTHVLTGGLYKLPFDLLTDLVPIILIGSEPLLIVAKKSLPADDLKGLIAWLKTNPDKASVGIAGVGAAGHLAGISFQKATGTQFQFVPYRGNGPAMQDLLAEQIDFMIEPSSNFKALLAAGSVKPFAVTGKARLPSSPNIPTADEAGLSGFFASLWYGLWVPKGTPKDITAKLNATMTQILFDPQVRQRFDELGIQISPLDQQSPEALRAFQKAEAERWWPIIKASNIKAE